MRHEKTLNASKESQLPYEQVTSIQNEITVVRCDNVLAWSNFLQSNLDQKEVDIFNLTDNSWRGDLEFVKTLLLQMVSDDTDIVWNLQGLFLPWYTYLL